MRVRRLQGRGSWETMCACACGTGEGTRVRGLIGIVIHSGDERSMGVLDY